jgi:flagellar hook-length control protein FliK
MAATKQSDGTATPSSDAQSTPPKANSDTKAGGAGSEVGAVAIKTPSAPGAKEPPSAQEPTATAPRSTLAVNPAASGQTQGQASNGQNGHADGGAKQGATNKGQGNSTAEQRAAALADRLANATAAERALNSLAAGQGQTDNAASPPQDGFDGALIQATQSQTGANAADAPLSASHARPAPPAPGVQLAVQIHAAVSNRLQRFSIRLEPAELGRIDVRLEFSRDGHVRARVSADRRETLDLLQKDVHGLERALRDAGANADKLNLTFDLRGDGRQAGAGSDRGSQAPKGEGAGGLGDAQPDADETPQPTRRIDALVDMHV